MNFPELEPGFETFDSPPDRQSSRPTVLIVDDEPLMIVRLERLCSVSSELSGSRILKAKSLEEARSLVAGEQVHVMTLDKNLGEKSNEGVDCNGIEAIPEFLGLRPDLKIIVHTGSTDISDVVRAIKLGAADYIRKGSDDDTLIEAKLAKAVHEAKISAARTRMEKVESSCSIPTVSSMSASFKSESMKKVVRKLEAVSESNRPVLLLGESGAGKTTIARAIHEYRKKFLRQEEREFFAVNLTALASSLIERELFGNEKGAFTGAQGRQVGFIELANGGTLFIDEIGDVSLDIQSKLMTVLDKGEFYRLGGTRPIKSRFKLVCATNKDLNHLVHEGRFREDFLARISTFPIEVPALRERREDIPDLVRSLLPQISKDARLAVSYEEIPNDFVQALVKNPPRLNVRGLEIALHQLLTLAPRDSHGERRLDRWRSIPELAELTVRRLKEAKSTSEGQLDFRADLFDENFVGLPRLMAAFEERILLEAKKRCGTSSRAAELLKISQGSMSLKLKAIHLRTKPDELAQ